MKKGLVISGGGAYGAFGVGTLAALNKDYDIVAGISTGALMGSLVALKKFEILKEAYTSVTQDDIFDKKWYRPNTFKKDGTLNELAVIYVLTARMFTQKEELNTLGTTKQMRKLIDKFFTEEHFKLLKDFNKEVLVGAVNINSSPSELFMFSSMTEKFEDFKDWVWCSANAPFVTSLIRKKWYDAKDEQWYDGEWTDGGLTELAPIKRILDSGCKEIDIIMHRVKPTVVKQRPFVKDFLQNIARSVDAMRFDIEFKDGDLIEFLSAYAKANDVKINIYWLPRKLANNSLMFDKKVMSSWFDEGFISARDVMRIDKLG